VSPEQKEPVEVAVEGEVTLQVQYPLNPRELPQVYANFIAIQATAEEVVFDACTVQPGFLEVPKKSESGERSVPALAVSRIIVSRAHAARFAEALKKILENLDAKLRGGK
jgi:Protein of unknown function (DUF3467)